MDLGLKSKTAVVTGASIGIGRAIAKGLAAEGVRVVGVARRTDLLAELVKEVGGGLITPFEQDVMAKDAAEKISAFAVKELGHVDILINNAGGSRPLPVDAPDSKWDEAIALNFTSYRRIAHALLPQMIERKWGRIVNITGKSEPEGLNAAFAAKAAVHAWAKGLSREIGEHGITINCIPPGRIMSEQIRRNYPPDYRERFAEEEIPVGYWGEPEDLAALAVFLASPVARYITGTVIPVDGGLRTVSVLTSRISPCPARGAARSAAPQSLDPVMPPRSLAHPSVAPIRIELLYQLELPRTPPALQRMFARPRFHHQLEGLEIDQQRHIILPGESGYQLCLVLAYSDEPNRSSLRCTKCRFAYLPECRRRMTCPFNLFDPADLRLHNRIASANRASRVQAL